MEERDEVWWWVSFVSTPLISHVQAYAARVVCDCVRAHLCIRVYALFVNHL